LDNATELISQIQPSAVMKYTPPPEPPKWYEPSDKNINKNVLNIHIPNLRFNKELKLEKDTNGNTIIGNTIVIR